MEFFFMKNKKLNTSLEVYGLIGKSIFACAGGIVGFIAGGPFLALPCILVGNILGYMLERICFKQKSYLAI
jgi:hypothetical protein